MIVQITNNAATGIERGVYYFDLADYPNISASELENLRAFIAYEKMYGRQTEIVCGDDEVLAGVRDALARTEAAGHSDLSEQNACCTVYHGTDIDSAKLILSGGRLLSAVRVYGKSGDALAYEKRDSPWNDPPDFFEYIMFGWGDSAVGDDVLMSGTPEGEDCAEDPERFVPGIRFYFRYADLLRHPGHASDGYHAIKVKDEILLSEYLLACIVPETHKKELEGFVLPELAARVHYLPHGGLGLQEWSERVYGFISGL